MTSRVREAPGWPQLYTTLSRTDAVDEAWFLAEDNVPSLPTPTAQIARVQSWDGQTAVVDHDGSCVLILRRTYYPGWYYRVNNGLKKPVLKVDGGLQGIQLSGSGTSQISVHYQPTDFPKAMGITGAALSVAFFTLVIEGLVGWKRVALNR